MSLSEVTRQRISDLVANHRVILFMKGNRQFPQCGFSARVVRILDTLVPAYEAVNVLADSELREGVKEYSSWPTLPQLYVDGQFIGGCDIVTELHRSGRLREILGATESGESAAPIQSSSVRASANGHTSSRDARVQQRANATAEPKGAGSAGLKVTDRAAEKLRGTFARDGEALHLRIDAEYQYSLFFGAPNPDDIELSSNGISVRIDSDTAARVDGTVIDYIGTEDRGGYRIENAHQPARVRPLRPMELKRLLESRVPIQLVDVRTEEERGIASIQGSIAMETEDALKSLDPEQPVVMYCHHGVRSRAAAERLVRDGFRKVYNLEGGIDAWATEVDASVARY